MPTLHSHLQPDGVLLGYRTTDRDSWSLSVLKISDLHDPTVQEGKRSCHWAALFGAEQALHDVLEHRPNLEAKDLRGNTALHLAAASDNL